LGDDAEGDVDVDAQLPPTDSLEYTRLLVRILRVEMNDDTNCLCAMLQQRTVCEVSQRLEAYPALAALEIEVR
jgi:hypothetical protein